MITHGAIEQRIINNKYQDLICQFVQKFYKALGSRRLKRRRKY